MTRQSVQLPRRLARCRVGSQAMPAVERINGYDFPTVEEKADIFYHNGARFLGLSEEMIARHLRGYRHRRRRGGGRQ